MRKLIIAVVSTTFTLAAFAAAIAHFRPGLVDGDKFAFAGRCAWNRGSLAGCACMYEVRREFLDAAKWPQAYAEIVSSWAHDPDRVYRDKRNGVILWQSVRAIPVVGKALADSRRERKDPDAVWGEIMRKAGEDVLRRIAERAGIRIVPVAIKLRMAADVAAPAWDFARARGVISRQCGGKVHQFVEPIEEAQKKIEEQIGVFKGTLGDIAEDAKKRLPPLPPVVGEAIDKAKEASRSLFERGREFLKGILGQRARAETAPGDRRGIQ